MNEKVSGTGQSEKNTAKNRLFSNLEDVLELSLKKFKRKRANDRDRRAWARIVISACGTYGKLYSMVELEELQKRFQILENAAKEFGLKLED